MAVEEKWSPIFLGSQSLNELWIVQREFEWSSGDSLLHTIAAANNGNN